MKSDIEIKTYTEVDNQLVDQLIFLDEKVFPKPLSSEKLRGELSSKYNISVLVAFMGGTPIAYKVGFERSKRIYYSWIGGVVPEFRGKGIASQLMKMQHDHAKNLGYKVVCTQTDNSFKPMIILNLKSGFGIKGTIQSTGDDHITIVMEKDLTQ